MRASIHLELMAWKEIPASREQWSWLGGIGLGGLACGGGGLGDWLLSGRTKTRSSFRDLASITWGHVRKSCVTPTASTGGVPKGADQLLSFILLATLRTQGEEAKTPL